MKIMMRSMNICEQLPMDVKMPTEGMLIVYQVRIRMHWNRTTMAAVK